MNRNHVPARSGIAYRLRRNTQSIQLAISSGARAPGLTTLRSVFGYCGKPFLRLEAGAWKITHGWLDMQRHVYPAPVGARLLGSCDVPDLTLLPRRYPDAHTVIFKAGFAGVLGHLMIWAASQLVRLGLVRSLTPLVKPLHVVSKWIEPLGSDKGAMSVTLDGIGSDNKPLHLTWHLIAAQNHGPHIPCGASVALGRKLARGEKPPAGAMPCIGLLSVDDYLRALEGYAVLELPP